MRYGIMVVGWVGSVSVCGGGEAGVGGGGGFVMCARPPLLRDLPFLYIRKSLLMRLLYILFLKPF